MCVDRTTAAVGAFENRFLHEQSTAAQSFAVRLIGHLVVHLDRTTCTIRHEHLGAQFDHHVVANIEEIEHRVLGVEVVTHIVHVSERIAELVHDLRIEFLAQNCWMHF